MTSRAAVIALGLDYIAARLRSREPAIQNSSGRSVRDPEGDSGSSDRPAPAGQRDRVSA